MRNRTRGWRGNSLHGVDHGRGTCEKAMRNRKKRKRTGTLPQRRSLLSLESGLGIYSKICSLLTKPTPPVHPEGGLLRT